MEKQVEFVLGVVEDLVANFLYYDRKSDEELPRGEIERMIAAREISVEDLVERFRTGLQEALGEA